jgi:hypothetical protein
LETNQFCYILKMASKIYLVSLNGSNYVVLTPYMDTLLKSKGSWKYTNTVISDPIDNQMKFVVDEKKDEDLELIMTNISLDI